MSAESEDRRRLIETWQRLFAQCRDTEALVECLRDRGATKVASLGILHDALGMSTREAKRIVHLSKTWRDRHAGDETLHDTLEREAREYKPRVRRDASD